MGTFGVCFKPCTLPGSSEPMFRLDKNNIEFGLGVHGEAGISTVQVSHKFMNEFKCISFDAYFSSRMSLLGNIAQDNLDVFGH